MEETLSKLQLEAKFNRPNLREAIALAVAALASLDDRLTVIETSHQPPAATPPEIHAGEVEDIRGREENPIVIDRDIGSFSVENFGTPHEKVGPLVRKKGKGR